jgi:hypothetical protein
MSLKRILFLIVKVLTFIIIGFILFNQLSKIDSNDWNNISIKSYSNLIFCILLIPVNWGTELQKWKLTNSLIIQSPNQKNILQSFFAGLLTGIVTPSMLGNFIGRLFYFDRKYRPLVILATSYTNFTQFFASILFGFLSILILNQTPFGESNDVISLLILILILSLTILNFRFEKIPTSRFKVLKRFNFFFQRIASSKNYRISIFILSLLRHFVFTVQFWLLLNTFLETNFASTFFWIWQIFFWTTLLPSLWFGKLFIRESVALIILGNLGFDKVGVLLTSVLLWIFNLGIPSIFALLFTKRSSK